MFTKIPFLKRYLTLLALLLVMSVLVGIFYVDISISDLNSGFLHPLDGWDHIVTMLGVGIWAAQLRGKAIWLLPITFVGVMSLGGMSGAAKYLIVPSAEILIVLSCLVFSILVIRKVCFSIKVNVLIVAFFAFFHGYAHGQEISASASLISYTAGFMLATLMLHGAGILAAKIILLSLTFFIAQALNVFVPTKSVETVTTSYSQITYTDISQHDTLKVEKPSLINLLHWLKLSPTLEILLFFNFVRTYFTFCLLLLFFSVAQFVCYVFYVKQRLYFLSLLARYFKNPLHFFAVFLTLSRLNLFFFSNPQNL